MKKLIIAFLVSGAAAFAAFGQNDAINVSTDLVTLNVAVTDKAGNFVRGLTKEDFALADDGRPQDIQVFSAEDSALSIGIVYDMRVMDSQAESVLAALKRFTARLGPQDDFVLTVFNGKGGLTAGIVPDIEQLRRHLAEPDAGSPSSLYDSIFKSAEAVRKLRNAKKYLIVISDGSDRNSQRNLKDLRLRLRSVNLPLYSLTFTPGDQKQYGYLDMMRDGPRQAFKIGQATELDRNVVAELSRSTGGAAFESSVRNEVYLAALARNFLDEARSQYVIGFSPDKEDGRWHKLKVSVKGGHKVSSRNGYQSVR